MGYFQSTPTNEPSHETSPAETPPEEPVRDDSPSNVSPFVGIPPAALVGSMFQHLNTCNSQPHQNGKKLLKIAALSHVIAALAYFSANK